MNICVFDSTLYITGFLTTVHCFFFVCRALHVQAILDVFFLSMGCSDTQNTFIFQKKSSKINVLVVLAFKFAWILSQV